MAVNMTDELAAEYESLSDAELEAIGQQLTPEEQNDVVSYVEGWRRRGAPGSRRLNAQPVPDDVAARPFGPEEPGLLDKAGEAASSAVGAVKDFTSNFGFKNLPTLPQSITGMQQDANMVAREVLGGKASLNPVTGIANIVDPNNAEQRAGSEAERYVQANIFANTPGIGWAANRQKLESHPVAGRVMDRMADATLPTTGFSVSPGLGGMPVPTGRTEPGVVGGALQTALDVTDPSMVFPSVTAAKTAVRGAPTIFGALKSLAGAYLKGTAVALPQLAAANALQAPEGQRLEAAGATLQDPLAWLLAIPGSLSGNAPALKSLEARLVESGKQRVKVLGSLPAKAVESITAEMAAMRSVLGPQKWSAEMPALAAQGFTPSIAEYHVENGRPMVSLLDIRTARMETFPVNTTARAKKFAKYREDWGLQLFGANDANTRGLSLDMRRLIFGSDYGGDVAIIASEGGVRLVSVPEPEPKVGVEVLASVSGEPPFVATVTKEDGEHVFVMPLPGSMPEGNSDKPISMKLHKSAVRVNTLDSEKWRGVTSADPTLRIPRANVSQTLEAAAGRVEPQLKAGPDGVPPVGTPARNPDGKTVEIPRTDMARQQNTDHVRARAADAAGPAPSKRNEPLPTVAGVQVDFGKLARSEDPNEHLLSFRYEGRTYDITATKDEHGAIIVRAPVQRGGGPGGEFKVVGHNPDKSQKLGRRSEPSEDRTVPLPAEIRQQMEAFMQEKMLNPDATPGRRAGDEAPIPAGRKLVSYETRPAGDVYGTYSDGTTSLVTDNNEIVELQNGATGNASQPAMPPPTPPMTPSIGGGGGPWKNPFIGKEVFVKTKAPANDPSRNYRDGRVVGFTDDGRVRVDVSNPATGKTHEIAVDAADVDLNMGAKGFGDVVREFEQLPNVLPSELGPGVGRAYELLKRSILAVPEGKSAFEKFTDSAVSVRMRQNTVAAHFAADELASRRLAQERGTEIAASVRRAFGGNLARQGEFDREVLKALEAERGNDGQAWAAIQEKYPEAWAVMESYIQPFLERRSANEQILVQLGFLPEDIDLISADNVKREWTARTYLSKMLKPGEWAKYAPTNVVSRARDELVKLYQKRNEALSEATLDKELGEILNVPDADERFRAFQASSLGSAFKHLKKRGDLPGWLREAMGEVPSGIYRMAMSMGIQEGLVSHLRLMREISNGGPMWASVGKQPDYKQMPDSMFYGDLRGKWVHPDIHEAIVGLPEAMQDASNFMASFMAYWKMNVVAGGGLDQWMHELWDNTRGSVLAGGVNLAQPVKSAQNVVGSFKDFYEYYKNPLGRNPSVDLVQEARLFGAIEPGHGHAEFTAQHRRLLDMVIRDQEKARRLEAKSKGESYWTVMKVLSTTLRGAKTAYSNLGHAYSMIQQVMQLASYKAQRERLEGVATKMWNDLQAGGDPARHGKAFWNDVLEMVGSDPTKVTWDLLRKQVRREAARRVRLSFVSPSNLHPKLHKGLSASVGVRAPFIVPFLEEARITAQLPRRLAREDDLGWRLGANAVVLGAAFTGAAMLRRMNGITDEEVELVDDFGKTKHGQHNGVMTPVMAWKDDLGRHQYMDLTWAYLPATMLKGDWRDSLWRRSLANLVSRPVEGGPFEGGVRHMLAQSGLIHPDPEPYEPSHSEASLSNVIQQLNMSGLAGPTMISQNLQTARSLGYRGVTPRQQLLTPGQAVARELGFPLRPVTMQNIKMQADSLVREYRQLLKERVKVMKAMPPNTARAEKIQQELMLIQERRQKLMQMLDAAAQSQGQPGLNEGGMPQLAMPQMPPQFSQSLLGGGEE